VPAVNSCHSTNDGLLCQKDLTYLSNSQQQKIAEKIAVAHFNYCFNNKNTTATATNESNGNTQQWTTSTATNDGDSNQQQQQQ